MNLASSFVALGLSMFAQFNPFTTTPPTLERFCGKLQQDQRDLRRVVVNLYPAAEGRECCKGATVASGVTGRWGSFNLKAKKLPGGLYWLEAETEGRKSSVLVQFKPKKYPDQLCSDTFWDVDGRGNIRVGRTITVD